MDDIITLSSRHSFEKTIERTISLIKEKGFVIFSCINHAAAAREHGLELYPTELILFGNPRIGTILMQDRQTCGIDLPVKILVWENANGEVRLSYNDMRHLKTKHQLSTENVAVLQKIQNVVAEIATEAGK